MKFNVKKSMGVFYKDTVPGRFIVKNRYYIMAFIIPLLILTAAYIALGVYPFGERQVQIIDSYHQYAPFFSEFYRKLWNGESLFYSFNGGLGMNFWAIVAYYLASPLNILLLLFPRGLLLEGFTFLLMLKIALASTTFSYYISKRFKTYNITIVYFALFYALCGWVLGYNWNIMWLDCLFLLPLIILGLERLVKQGKGLLYGITLALCIMSNYYIAIMICIFLVLYFFVLFFEQKKKNIRLFFRRGFLFAGYSLLAGISSAVLLLPTLAALAVSNSADSKFPTEIEFYHSFTELLSQQFAFVKPTDLSGSPNLYFGVMTLLLVVLYIFRKGIPLYVRIMKLVLLAFLLFSTNFRILDYIWHGFHFPNSLPARFTFIYAFLALSMAYEVVLVLRQYKYWQYFVSLVFVEGLVLWCWLDSSVDQEIYTYIITDILAFLYILWMYLYKGGVSRKKFFRGALMVLLVIEAAGNSIYGLCENGSINRTSYNQYLNSSKELKEITDEKEAGNFYRMELDSFSARNNNMWLDLPGVSLFASTMGADINDLMGQVGYFQATNKYSYVGATPLTDSILGIKYLVSTDKTDHIRTFNYVCSSDQQHLYENPYALSLGFMVDDSYENWNHNVSRPEYVLNDFVQKTTGTDRFMFMDEEITGLVGEGCEITDQGDGQYSYTKENQGDEASVKLSFDINDGVSRYIYYQAANCDSLKVSRNDSVETYSDTRGHMVELGDSGHVELEFVTDKDHSSGTIKIYMFSYNEEVFQQFYNDVSQHQWEIEEWTQTSIKGNITASEDGIMFTSIPYDSGWTVKVDGEKVEAQSIDGSLMYIHLSAGEHYVEMTYIPSGFVPGFILSAISCLIFVVLICRRLKNKNCNL